MDENRLLVLHDLTEDEFESVLNDVPVLGSQTRTYVPSDCLCDLPKQIRDRLFMEGHYVYHDEVTGLSRWEVKV